MPGSIPAVVVAIIASAALVWLGCEIWGTRWMRITSGFVTGGPLVILIMVQEATGEFAANNYYNLTTKYFVEQMITSLEHGQHDEVLAGLRQFDQEFYPRYENRANYMELVDAFRTRLSAAGLEVTESR